MMSSKQGLACLAFLSMLLLSGHASAQTVRIVALGDSNTAGFGVARQEAFPARLEAMLRTAGADVQVLNAGISGDTTTGMLSRLDSVTPQGTQIVIVQGGYNDMRRGGSPASVAANIEAILSRLRARGIKAVLCGFYNEPWDAIARRHGAVLVPSSTCYDARHRGFDGLHMNAAGHQIIASRLLPVVQRLLMPAERRRTSSAGDEGQAQAGPDRHSSTGKDPAPGGGASYLLSGRRPRIDRSAVVAGI